MKKLVINSLIIMASLGATKATATASPLDSNQLEISSQNESLTTNEIISNQLFSVSHLERLYPEITIDKLNERNQLSYEEEKLSEKISNFIEKTNFEEIISVFSSSLFEESPPNSGAETYEITDLANVYNNKIKTESKNYAQLIVQTNRLEEYDTDNVKQQLILLSYFIRWGNFSDGSRMFWHEVYSTDSSFLTQEQVKNVNSTFIECFSTNPTKYLASKNVNSTFAEVFKQTGINYSYKQSIETFLAQAGITEYSKWFYETFKGRVYKDHYEGTSYDVGIWNRKGTFDNFLPYLLNQSDNTNLMIGETRGELIFLSNYIYDKSFVTAEKTVRNAMKVVTNLLELYDRTIVSKDELALDKVVGQGAILDQGKQWLNPEDSLSYELYRVAGYKGSYGGSAALGGTGQIQMQNSTIGASDTIAHELGHEWNDLFKADGEFYSSYNADPGRQNAAYLNTYGDGNVISKRSDAVANRSTLQMQTKDDLLTYAKNMEDMAYVLDGIVATKVLELPIEEQVKYIKIAKINGVNGSVDSTSPTFETNHVQDLTIEELKALNLQSIEDLIDNDVVIMKPGDANKNLFKMYGQGYGTTLNHSAFFLTNGKTYQYNHRIINTLLAEDGWEGFKTFNTTFFNTFKEIQSSGLTLDEVIGESSLRALRKVYGDDTLTYRALVKKRYSESMKQFKEKGLLGQTYDEVLNDLTNMELANFYNYKYQMMNRYLNLTNDFSESIFGYNENVYTSVGSYSELYEAIEKDAHANILLSKGFEVKGKYAEKELPTFSGVLNGSGYTISKATHPLFKLIDGAEVKNLTLDEINIMDKNEEQIGGLVNTAENSKINNIHVINSNVQTSNTNKVSSGGLVGKSNSSQILNSSVQDSYITGSYVGGIAGIADNTKILNVYSTGKLENALSGDLRIGGIIGNGYNYTEVKNSYTTMHVTQGNGLLGSDYTGKNKHISFDNSISLADLGSTHKSKVYDYGVSLIPWTNNFEITEHSGQSSVSLENLDVTDISIDQVNQAFFADQLTWKNESIWGIDKDTSGKELPYLKNNDPRNKTEEDLSDLVLKTDHKEIYVGEEVDLMDLIEEVRDKEGNIVDKKEVEITGVVNTDKPGETTVVYKYNTIEKKVTIVVKENKTSVKVHHSTISIGDEWQAKDNFDGATDKDGKEVSFENITVGGDKVDTSKAGKYEVLYSYEGVQSKAIITVVEKNIGQVKVNVHDSTIYVGDEWQAKDNFDGATDKDGKEVSFENITVGGDKVDTSKAGKYEVLYSYEDVESKAIVTVKEKQTSFEKEANITFLEDEDTGTIVDPDNPDEGIEPVDPANPNGAELMISYASNLNFGVQSKQATSWNALADKVYADETHTTTREVTPFVATKDSRGSSRKGWTLTAKQDTAFKDETKEILKGAEISFTKLSYASLEGAPKASTVDKIVLSQDAQDIAKATASQGVGAWSLALGALDGEVEQGTEDKKVTNKTTSGVTLSVPSTTSKNTGSYSTTVTWELAADPTVNQ